MHEALRDIPDRILNYAMGALTQANHHAVFFDPGNEHWGFMSVVNTAHAGELFLKAIIAKAHPLLIFKDFFSLDSGQQNMDFNELVRRGKTHDFDKLPKVLWAATGERIPNIEIFNDLRETRNAIQHFCASENDTRFRRLSLDFIYSVIDPLINKHFDLHAIEFHEDHSVGYDHVVGCLLRHEIRFSVPEDFEIHEIDLHEELKGASAEYKNWFANEMAKCSGISL
ncbi:hypothetical protein [Pseudovibrio exalbescens]|uniref:Uncharacterized protein n=1 Tax=Pseudovibrio exalbescens TaxID=197461 RepID=A0A1U7JDW1_9HYPH|nr:hypothetical protein [Pseudovibrio exalbescens]OKL42907.1 hypothetical protein A3843_16245 [Pseudovibrio exalbescens]